MAEIVAAAEQAKPKVAAKGLCTVHRLRLKKIAPDRPGFLNMIKVALRSSLLTFAHPRKHPKTQWRQWFAPFGVGCPVCRELSSQESTLCRVLTQCLSDTEFWKAFSRAPLLCLDHLDKCLSLAQPGVGCKRLVNDQSAKLDGLLNELVRFEATGKNVEYKTAALDWFVSSAWPPVDGSETDAPFAEPDLVVDSTSHTGAELATPETEQLLFENEKLRRQVRELMNRLNELESRAASLHYRAAQLSDDNKRLEMGYTGANTQAEGLKQLVRDLRQEIEHMKNGSTERDMKESKTTTRRGEKYASKN